VCSGATSRVRYSFAPFRVNECPGCGSAYLSPRLRESEIIRLYRENYFASDDSGARGYTDYAALEQELRQTFLRRYRLLKPHLTRRGRAVDLGCAMGYALDCLTEDFDERIGIDLAPQAIDEVVRRGHRGICGMLAYAALETRSVSLLVSSDTIEHLYDPTAAVREMARVLAPGGVLALVTPNYGSVLRRVSGRNWVSFKIPEHVTYFSKKGMTDMLASAGLDVLGYHTDFQYSPLDLILDRGSKVLPRAGRLAKHAVRLIGGNRSVLVYNGMFMVVARKPA